MQNYDDNCHGFAFKNTITEYVYCSNYFTATEYRRKKLLRNAESILLFLIRRKGERAIEMR